SLSLSRRRIFLFLPFYFFSLLRRTRPPDLPPLSLHDALPISAGAHGRASAAAGGARPRRHAPGGAAAGRVRGACRARARQAPRTDRKSTRLNSSHVSISYAVFCLKKKNTT